MVFLEKGDNLRDEGVEKNPCQQISIAIFNEHLTTVLLKNWRILKNSECRVSICLLNIIYGAG